MNFILARFLVNVGSICSRNVRIFAVLHHYVFVFERIKCSIYYCFYNFTCFYCFWYKHIVSRAFNNFRYFTKCFSEIRNTSLHRCGVVVVDVGSTTVCKTQVSAFVCITELNECTLEIALVSVTGYTHSYRKLSDTDNI